MRGMHERRSPIGPGSSWNVTGWERNTASCKKRTGGRHFDSKDPGDLEAYRAALNNLLVQLAVLALNEGREGHHRYR